VGAAIVLFIFYIGWEFFNDPGKTWNNLIGSASMAVIICGSISVFAGVIGLLVGMFIALLDSLAHGWMRTNDFPFWLWLPIGVVLGVIGGALIFLLVDKFFPAAAINGISGLIAGPIFGWLYRERTQPDSLHHKEDI
jgi:H+/Cl- antiporter ClcA